MSLINCPECGRTVSDRVSVCPNCGAPMHSQQASPNSVNNQNYNSQYQRLYQQQSQPMNYGQRSIYRMPFCPKTWLTEAILATIFCCMPFGIVAIVYASQVVSFYKNGNYASAEDASNNAKKYINIALISGLIIIILNIILYALYGAVIIANLK